MTRRATITQSALDRAAKVAKGQGGTRYRNGVLITDWQWLIRLAWGPRRVSSRALDGTSAYPESVGATPGLWLAWICQRWNRKAVYVVVTAQGADHGADYMAMVAEREKQQQAERMRALMTPEQIASIQNEREAARLAKNFALADKLRDELIAAGVVVADGKAPAP